MTGAAQGRAKESLRKAEEMDAHWLYLGNRASERGQKELAERHYARAQKWHDLMNEALAKLGRWS